MLNKNETEKNILITGASGMLGASLHTQFPNAYATGSSDYEGNPFNKFKPFDLKEESYVELITWSKPDVIIHCAALTDGNCCAQNPEEAFLINGHSVRKLLESSDSHTRIIYISTDAVFPSSLSLAKEDDFVFPESIYGKSKELGEFYLHSSNRQYNIVRTTIVGTNLNKSKQGFVEWILESNEAAEISLFDDVFFNPISIWHLGAEIKFLIENDINESLLHISGSKVYTKYDFGIELLNSLELSTSHVKRGSISNFSQRAKRSTNQSLNCNYYQNKYNRKLPNLLDTISSIKSNYYEKYYQNRQA